MTTPMHTPSFELTATFCGVVEAAYPDRQSFLMGNVFIKMGVLAAMPSVGAVVSAHARYNNEAWHAISVHALQASSVNEQPVVSDTQKSASLPSKAPHAAVAEQARPESPPQPILSGTTPKPFGFGRAAKGADAPKKRYQPEPRESLFSMPKRPVAAASATTPPTAGAPSHSRANGNVQPSAPTQEPRRGAFSKAPAPATPLPALNSNGKTQSVRGAFSRGPGSESGITPAAPPAPTARGTLNKRKREDVLKAWCLTDAAMGVEDIPY